MCTREAAILVIPPLLAAVFVLALCSVSAQVEQPADAQHPAECRRVMDNSQRLEQWQGYAQAQAEKRIVYVAGDGSGDFNCDGTDDQVEISQALQRVAADAHLTTVHLKGPHTYTISDTIRIGSHTILQGDADAVLTVIPHQEAQWQPFKGLIECDGHGVQNITIRGFEILGNRASFSSDRHYYSLNLMNAYDVTINDMYIHDASGDGIKLEHRGTAFVGTGPDQADGSWVKINEDELGHFNELQEARGRSVNSRFYNNHVESVGHDGIYILSVDDFEVYNNYVFNCRTNSTVRLSGCSDYSIHDNVLRSHPARVFSGNAGVQAQSGSRQVDNVEIYGNEIFRMALGGIVIYGRAEFGTQTGFHVHDNIIYDCAIAGIRIYGAHNTVVENNILYGNHGDGILHWFLYTPLPENRRPGEPPAGEKYTTIVRNNIIAGTLPLPARTMEARAAPLCGFGLNNCVVTGDEEDPSRFMPDNHRFISEHNCIWNNVKGPYNNAASDTDIHADPLFVDAENADFRLQPGSPCRGAGTDGQDLGVRRAEE